MQTIEGAADMILAAFVFNVTIAADLTHNIGCPVFDCRELFRVAALTWLITRGRHGHRERFMGTLSVVDHAPLVKDELPLRQRVAGVIAQDFRLESAMKAFVFTLVLRMMWA